MFVSLCFAVQVNNLQCFFRDYKKVDYKKRELIRKLTIKQSIFR